MKKLGFTAAVLAAALLAAPCLTVPGQALAGEPEKIITIPAPPASSTGSRSQVREDIVPCFDGSGIIDRWDPPIVVISDSGLRLAPGVKYYNKLSRPTTVYRFGEGVQVGYKLDKNRQITALYLTD